jgi:8-oxo-dGTP diphosphatase
MVPRSGLRKRSGDDTFANLRPNNGDASGYGQGVVYTIDYPITYVTVDVVVLTIRSGRLCALAVRRGGEPFQGMWALPGGFVEPDEDLEHAAIRELAEETSVSTGDVRLEQLATYGAPDRDPRHRTVSVAWLAVLTRGPEPRAGSDAAHAEWQPVDHLLADERLAFDHAQILADGLERARAKLEYTNIATAFAGEEFTIAELRSVYEVVWGEPLDPGNFHRKVTKTRDFVVSTGRHRSSGRGRPAELFRAGAQDFLSPPLTRGSLA